MHEINNFINFPGIFEGFCPVIYLGFQVWGGPKNLGGGSFSKPEKNCKLIIFKVLRGPGAGTGAVAQGSRRGKLRKGRDVFLMIVKNEC